MNKKVKRGMYLLLALVMTVSSILTAHATSNVGGGTSVPVTTYYFSQSFEAGAEKLGEFAPDNGVTIVEDSSLGQSAFKITASEKGSLYGSLSETITAADADAVYIEMNVSGGNPVAAFGNMTFTFRDADNVDTDTIWTTNAKGEKFKLALEDWLKFVAGDFLKVGLKLTFNTAAEGEAANGTCELYQLDASGNWGDAQKTISGLSITSLSKLRFKFNGTVADRSLFLDNVNVYTIGTATGGDGSGDDSGSGDGSGSGSGTGAQSDGIYFHHNFEEGADAIARGTVTAYNSKTDLGYVTFNNSRVLKIGQKSGQVATVGAKADMEESIPTGKRYVFAEMDIATTGTPFEGYIQYADETGSYNAVKLSKLSISSDSFMKLGLKIDTTEGNCTTYIYNTATAKWEAFGEAVTTSNNVPTSFTVYGAKADLTGQDLLVDNLKVYVSDEDQYAENGGGSDDDSNEPVDVTYFHHNFEEGADKIEIGSVAAYNSKTELSYNSGVMKISQKSGQVATIGAKATMSEAISADFRYVFAEMEISTTGTPFDGYIQYADGTGSYNVVKLNKLPISSDSYIKLGLKIDTTEGNCTAYVYDAANAKWEAFEGAVATSNNIPTEVIIYGLKADLTGKDLLVDNMKVYASNENHYAENSSGSNTPDQTVFLHMNFEEGEDKIAIGTYKANDPTVAEIISYQDTKWIKLTDPSPAGDGKKLDFRASVEGNDGVISDDKAVFVEFNFGTSTNIIPGNVRFIGDDGTAVRVIRFDKNGRIRTGPGEDLLIIGNTTTKLGMKITLNTASVDESPNGKIEIYGWKPDQRSWTRVLRTIRGVALSNLKTIRVDGNDVDQSNGDLVIDNLKVRLVEPTYLDRDISSSGSSSSGSTGSGVKILPEGAVLAHFNFEDGADKIEIGRQEVNDYIRLEKVKHNGSNWLKISDAISVAGDTFRPDLRLRTTQNITDTSKDIFIEMDLAGFNGMFNGNIRLQGNTTNRILKIASSGRISTVDSIKLLDVKDGESIKLGMKVTLATPEEKGVCKIYIYDEEKGNWGDAVGYVYNLDITSLNRVRIDGGDVDQKGASLLIDNFKITMVDHSYLEPVPVLPPTPPADFDSTGKSIHFYKDYDGLELGVIRELNTSSYLDEEYEAENGQGLSLYLSQKVGMTKFYGYHVTMFEKIPYGAEDVIIEMDLSTVKGQFDGYLAIMEQNSIYSGGGGWNLITSFKDGCFENVSADDLNVVPGKFVKIGIKLNYKEGTWTLHAYDEKKGWSGVLSSGELGDVLNETALEKVGIFGKSDSDASIDPETVDMLVDNIAVYRADDFVGNPAWLLWDHMGAPRVQTYVTSLYEIPSITPPVGEHPRVMFTRDDIPTIKANLTHPENAIAYEEFLSLKDKEVIGELPLSAGDNSNMEWLAIIEAKAFDYVINGNVENGKEAISAIINYVKTNDAKDSSSAYHHAGYAIFTASQVYDWCYDLLDEATKEEIVARCQALAANNMSVGSPPIEQTSIQSHGAEYQLSRDWMAFAIATYDEYPFIWEVTAGRYFQEYVPTRNWLYNGGAPYQGTGYGAFRTAADFWAQLLISNMDKDDDVERTITENAQMYPYWFIYARRPDYRLIIDGDTTDASSEPIYWHNRSNRLNIVAASFYKDGYIKGELLRSFAENMGEFGYGYSNISAVHMLALNDTTVEPKPASELPLVKYSGSPTGSMIARTGWKMGLDSEDVVAYMKIGETYMGNHAHRDTGSFQIYYKGNLAIDSGSYISYGSNHNLLYNQSSVAHNTLAITSNANPTGVQRKPDDKTYNEGIEKINENLSTVTFGKVVGQEYQQTDETLDYAYIAGNIAAAYDSNVKDAVRNMLLLPLDDEDHAAAFVVFDRITSLERGTKKIFQLHSLTEPEIDGNVIRIINTTDTYDPEMYGQYNGMLTNQTLLPAADDIEIFKLGGEGRAFWAANTNLDDSYGTKEQGWGRVEISTMTFEENKTDYMLNVMYVNDADKKLELEEAVLIETDKVAGAQIFNRVAVFNKELINKNTRCADEMKFTIPSGDEAVYKVNVTGLAAGTWNITTSNGTITATATEDGGLVYFEAPAGDVTLTYVEEEVEDDGVSIKDLVDAAKAKRTKTEVVNAMADNKIPLIIAGIVLILAVAGVSIYFVQRKRKDNK